MDALGLIFADSFDSDLGELIDKRTLAAVPFGGRYRVIDFLLSNLINAGVRDIGIVTTQDYYSLMNHVRAGGVWDLDRKQSGLTFLPPFAQERGSSLFENRLEHMQANLSYIRHSRERYVIISNPNYIGNIDLQSMLDFHIRSGMDITGMYAVMGSDAEYVMPFDEYIIDERGAITDIRSVYEGRRGMNFATGLYIMEREYLVRTIENTMREKRRSFREDVLIPACKEERVISYRPTEPMLFLDGLAGYLKSNLSLLNTEIRDALFHIDDRPVVTRVKDSPPTKYGRDAVALNSLIADGALIEGEVRNSIIFRGVHVRKNAVVENSVIMQDSTIGEGARLNYVVLDKNVIINDGRLLSGYITHPFYVGHRTVI